MSKKKTALLIAALTALAAVSSCGNTQPSNTQATETSSPATSEDTTSPKVSEETEASQPTEAETSAQTSETVQTEAGEDHSERTYIDESELDGYIDKLFTSNQRSEVFKRHSSLTSVTQFNIELQSEYISDLYYYTNDTTYYSAPAYEEYSKPDVRYELLNIASDWHPTASYYIDLMEGGYQYWYIPEDRNEWSDPEHEHPIEAYVEGGLLYITTVCDEVGTEAFYNSRLFAERPYGTLRCEIICDAETFDFIETIYYLESDGGKEQILTDYFFYDQEPPHGAILMRAFFENEDLHMVTVTAVLEPGTENELTKSITIPMNSHVSFFVPGNAEIEYFTDYECTQPFTEQWDGMTDVTVYIKPEE